ncbi:piggyBac transposable element-derived protein 4-like [Salvelinus fontinalis]|uniref:piggyBac transposable element-derived protein 4-like n=1 Tax=Salvelinus fontinalis TaxID=8038 RepID=UPI002486678A|nr:piggyBac transposable element-derived protein 4-like [Salvelinus fontinalis]
MGPKGPRGRRGEGSKGRRAEGPKEQAIERIIVDMTNLQGVRKYGDGWRPMDSTDLRAYVGLLILAGVYRSRGEAAASLWDAESGRTVFRATMPLKAFHKYSRLLRFDDRQSRPARLATDRLAAVREVWDLWEERLQALYNPGPEVTVDEQLVPFRGRCPFRQYIPSKPAKYGIKSWVACDAKSSYAWKMQVYTGKAAGGCPEKNQGARVVLDLTEGLPTGHNVTCDNFFTSYELGQRLLERNLTMVGTVRKNKPELPPALLQSKGRQVSSSRFAFTPTATLVSYLAKRNKNVLLLSTRHAEPDVSDRRDRKPALILDYNCNKGGVDNLDKVVGTYSCRRMTARWPLVIFHNILDVSSYNAFVIWREINPDWMPGKRNKRRVFLEQLGKALVKPLIQRRQRLPRTEAASALVKVIRGERVSAEDRPQARERAAGPAAAAAPAAPLGASKRKRCQGYEIGNSHIPQAVRSSGSKSSDSESSSGADMAGDYEDWMCDDYQDNCQEDYTHNRDTPGADMEDTRDQEAETSPRSPDSLVDYDIYDSEESDYEVHTQDVDSEQLYSEQVDDEEVVYCEEVYGEEVDTGAVVECEEVDDDEVVDYATFVARPKNHIFGDEGLQRHPGVTDARHNV